MFRNACNAEKDIIILVYTNTTLPLKKHPVVQQVFPAVCQLRLLFLVLLDFSLQSQQFHSFSINSTSLHLSHP